MNKSVIPPSTPLGISNQKPMKRTIIRKHKMKKHTRKDLVFNKVFSYLISDCYMYNPLVSSQSTFDFPPPKQIITSPGKCFFDQRVFSMMVSVIKCGCKMYVSLY